MVARDVMLPGFGGGSPQNGEPPRYTVRKSYREALSGAIDPVTACSIVDGFNPRSMASQAFPQILD